MRATRPSSASNTIATKIRIAAVSNKPTTDANDAPGADVRNASATLAMARKPKNTLPRVIRLGSTGTSLSRRSPRRRRALGKSSMRGVLTGRMVPAPGYRWRWCFGAGLRVGYRAAA